MLVLFQNQINMIDTLSSVRIICFLDNVKYVNFSSKYKRKNNKREI